MSEGIIDNGEWKVENDLSEWREVALGDLLTFGNGKRKPSADGDIPIYGGNGILGFTNDSNYQDKTIIIGRVGAYCGAVYYETRPIWVSDNALSAKPKNNYNLKFLYYFLRQINLNQYAGGSSHPLVTQTLLNSLEFDVCTNPDIQKAIAEVLSSLDDKIDLLHRQNKTLEQIAQTLFRQWFVIDAREDWEEKPLSSVANFLNGLACQKFPPKNEVDKLPVLKIKQLRNGFSDDCDWCTTEVKPEYIIENGDVIFSWSASLMVKIWDGEKCILNQHLFKVTSDDFPKWFYYLWSKHHLAEFVSISSSHATTMGHIKRGDLDDAMALVPSPNELKEMTNEIQPLIDKQISNSKQIRTLESLRDTLLPKLMNGEVRVDYKKGEN